MERLPKDDRRKRKDGTRYPDIFTPYRESVTLFGRQAAAGKLLLGPLEAELVFVFERTLAHAKRSAPLGRIPLIMKKRNDIDNLCKGVFDALSGYLFEDDGQIYDLRATRWYAACGEPAHTEITIRRRV